ncbi:Zinc finger CCHC domain-containing protein 3 [Holothuria leucospilota]|uniref:Zinc finger CCHC domain-containing protein 3 n=1 Tax=Holothuria leucospilota TaxID=206669 RepID=A0A9Q1CPP9_HOLLE|nr:Zinc finger CCHC domain-containing protein 3 [Holothuria leucospilota]KAJ8049114.1 Zinc finger CCHC domain-containing protein 3 [Holothuria leucospilota]
MHLKSTCPNRRCGRCRQVGHDKAECPNGVRCNLCGEEGHVFGACPELYSTHASEDVGQAPEPSQLGPEYSTQELEEVAHEVEQDFLASKQCEAGTVTPEADSPPSLPTEPREAAIMTIEEDLHLSYDGGDDDGGEPASEPPPKDPPSGEGWFDLCEGKGSESALKRSASGEVSEWGDRLSERPVPSPRTKKIKSQQELLVCL